MTKQDNLFSRAFNAIVDGRTRQAERYVAQYERSYGKQTDKVNSR